MAPDDVRKYVDGLTALARQLNTFTNGLRTVRAEQPKKKPAIREPVTEYLDITEDQSYDPLFSEDDLNSLNT
jgi:hypothetical protein